MPIYTAPDLHPALPELFTVGAAMALLMIGVFRGEGSARLVSWLAVAALVVAAFLTQSLGPERQVGFYGLFVSDSFAIFMKLLVLFGAAASVIMAIGFNEREGMARFEFPVLVLLATSGMLAMISANDLMSLYIGLELESLSLYVLASFKRDEVRSTEAGLKYFVLGALSSGMLLYGCTMVYGFAGTTSFERLAELLAAAAPRPASSSASSSSPRGSPSRSRPCLSICGPPTSTRERRRRSPPSSRWRPRSPPSRSSSAS